VPEPVVIHLRRPGKIRVFRRALDFLLRKFDQLPAMPCITLLQQPVGQHRTEGRRQRHGQPERDAVVDKRIHMRKQRQIGLGDRLEKPVFLEHIVVFRVPYKREMGVQHQAEIAA
jgi:hypothetical protein